MDNLQYTLKQYSCNNGVGASGTECPTHGDAKFTSCDSGYHVNDGICEANVCVCPGGTPSTSTLQALGNLGAGVPSPLPPESKQMRICNTNGTEASLSCNENYFMTPLNARSD